MSQHLTRKIVSLWIGTLLINGGCDERIVEVSREAANRQAEQNRAMAKLQQDVADGTRSLVDADANARRDFVAVHRDLQSERQVLDQVRNTLDAERREVALDRRTESLLAQVIPFLGYSVLLAALLAFLRQVLQRSTATDAIEAQLNELLIEELIELPTTGANIEQISVDLPSAPGIPAGQ